MSPVCVNAGGHGRMPVIPVVWLAVITGSAISGFQWTRPCIYKVKSSQCKGVVSSSTHIVACVLAYTRAPAPLETTHKVIPHSEF